MTTFNYTLFLQAEYHQQYGRMFKEKFGLETLVKLSDPDLIEQVYKAQGVYPSRPAMKSWIEWRTSVGESPGIVTTYVKPIFKFLWVAVIEQLE